MINYLNSLKLNKYLKKAYKKDKIIFHENDICKYVCILLSGHIVIKSYTTSGQEVIYNRINKGEIFGNNLLFSDNPYYQGDVIAIDDLELLQLNKDEFLDLLKSDEHFIEYYLQYQANRIKSINSTVKLLTITNPSERFMYYLKINNNYIEYKSITALSNDLYLTRETTSRLISKLVKNKEITKTNKCIKKPLN